MAAIAGYKTQLYLTSPPSVSMTNEAMTDSGDHTTFNVTNTAHQAWDTSAAFVVQTAPDGTTWTTAAASSYTINYAIGRIVFNAAVTGATPSARISSGKYFPLSFLGFGTSVEPTVTADTLETTAFTNPPSAWKTYIASQPGGEVKLSKWWIDNTMFAHFTAGDLLVLQIFPGQNANQRFQGYVVMKQQSVKIAQNAVVSDDLSFNVNGQLFYIAS